MADPVAYSVAYSFSGFQALNPDQPLPASMLDAELANIATANGDAVDAIKDIRRADGNLQNGVVTWDGLSEDVQTRITASDTRVTIGDLNPSAFSSQVEAEAGVANDKVMTPLRTKQALDALRALASQVEAEAGSNNTNVMTPLRVAQALDALRAFASQAEAEAGSNNTKVMTPLRTKQALDEFREAYNGTADLTWGAISAGASATQTITTAGAATGDRVILGLASSGVDAGLIAQAWVSSADTVTVRLTNITGSPITPHAGAATTYNVTAVRF